MSALEDFLEAHVERFNHGVATGDFSEMVAYFAEDASLEFEGVPAGPFVGRDAIADAYESQPPDDQVVLLDSHEVSPDTVVGDYRWRGEDTKAGEMRLTVADEQVTRLVVRFTTS